MRLGISSLFLLLAITLHAQPVTHHPTVSSVSPNHPTVNQTVTISGTDLLPPTWTATLQYKEKYGSTSALHEIALTGSSTALTFRAPTNMRPDSIAIQYSNASTTNAANNPIPTSERRPLVPVILVLEKPDLATPIGKQITSDGGTPFSVLIAGVDTLIGKNLLKPLSLTSLVKPSVTGGFTLDDDPAVSFGGTGLFVSSSRYVASRQDEVVISTTSLAHNTSRFMTLSTPTGSDSALVTVIRAPQASQVIDLNTGFAVTDARLVRGRSYRIRGSNLMIIQRVGSTNFPSSPTVRIAGIAASVFPTAPATDTAVFFKLPTSSSSATFGTLELSHLGGRTVVGNFTVGSEVAPLAITGLVAAPNEVIGGNATQLTLSFTPAPTIGQAGTLVVTIPPALAAAIPSIQPVTITANPMIITLPTNATSTTLSGSVTVKHDTPGGGNANVSLTIRPPRPTAVTVPNDTVAGSLTVTGSVEFDQSGPATVLLSSSDPSSASVPSSVVRSGSTATFTITTQAVTALKPITISAALNGVSTSKTIVLRPGRVNLLTVNPVAVAGQTGNLGVLFDVPVSGMPVTVSSSDTALRFTTTTGTANAQNIFFAFTTSARLAAPTTVTVSGTAQGITKTRTVDIAPIQVSQFTVSPTSGVGGTTIAGTARLSHTAFISQSLRLTSSDTTVATVPPVIVFNQGEDVKVFTITLKGPQPTARTATITAALQAGNNVASPVVSTKTATVSATP
jgi:hypothetical protein